MLFDTAMESYMGVTESLDSVMESWEGVEVEPTSRAFAEITREGAEDLARIESAIYVADVLIEGQLVDGLITEEQAQVVAEGAIKDFFSKIIAKLKELLNKVKAWFVAIGKKFKVYTMENKKFIATYEKEIKERASSDKIKFKCYKYDVKKGIDTVEEFSNYVKDQLDKVCDNMTTMHTTDSWLKVLQRADFPIKVEEDGTVKDTFWDDCKLGKSFAEIKEKAMEDFHNGEVSEREARELDITAMINALKSADIIKQLEAGYKENVSAYNRSIKDLETAQKMYNDDKNTTKGKENVAKFVKAAASKVSTLTSLYGNASELTIAIYKEFYTASARICKALVTKKPAKESYVDESQAENSGSILESALSFL